ncbi:uncharacterized protein [Littorina saxatilis]|uniref:Secreted protein n=1 Tax=Littorina saxatilis TaxID=31220 RepID=A0AAN9G022_9CAEN
MYRMIFLAAFAALVLPSAADELRKSAIFKHIKSRCFPDNVTKAACFADLPNAAHISSTMMSMLLPSADEDSYVINGVEDFDDVDFVVSRVEENPKYLCQYNDTFMKGLECMEESVKRKCPFLSSQAGRKYGSAAKGFNFVCSRIDEIDSVCLHDHWKAFHPCKEQVVGHMKEGFLQTKTVTSGKAAEPATTAKVPDNGTTIRKKGDSWGIVSCYFHYRMTLCLKESLESCHGPTAQVMSEFMRSMMTPNCSASMDQWDVEAEGQKSKQTSDCLVNHCGAASHSTPRVLMAFVLPALAALKMATW